MEKYFLKINDIQLIWKICDIYQKSHLYLLSYIIHTLNFLIPHIAQIRLTDI